MDTEHNTLFENVQYWVQISTLELVPPFIVDRLILIEHDGGNSDLSTAT